MEKQQTSEAVQQVIDRINNYSTWNVYLMDEMAKVDSQIFYLRSNAAHQYRNFLDEVVTDLYECAVRVAGDMIRQKPQETADEITKFATKELKVAKRCI